jgi:hypothetical protein
MAEDVDARLRQMYFNACPVPTFLLHTTEWGVIRVANVAPDGKINFFECDQEREMAKGVLSNAHLLLIIAAITINDFFRLEADAVLGQLGKDFDCACRQASEGQ